MSGKRCRAEWRGLVQEWAASGLSRGAFARSRGISAVTLGWWRWKLGVEEPAATAFLDVVVAGSDVEDEPAAPDLVVEVGQVRVLVPMGFDAHELRRLVDALC